MEKFKTLDHKLFMSVMTDREEEELLQNPHKFFTYMQNRYFQKNPELSKTFKEIADEHRRINREDACFRESIVNMAKTAGKNLKEDGNTRVSLWD